MKKTNILSIILVTLIAISITSSAYAVPMSINYQGKLTDPNGSVLNGEYQMSFSLFNTDTNGTTLWSEQQTIMVADGIYNVQLGAVNPLSADIFDNDALFLEVMIESETLSPRQRLTSVAFAIRAQEAESVGGFPVEDLVTEAEFDIKITNQTFTDDQIPDDITVNYAKDADKLDGKHASEFGDGHSLDAADHDPVDVLYVNANSNVSIIGLPDTDIPSGTAFVDIEGFSGYKLNVNGDIYVRGQDIIFSHGDSSHEGNRNIDSISYLDGTDQWGGYVPELDSAGVFTFFADTNYRSPWDQPSAAISAKGAYFKSNVGIGTASPKSKLHVEDAIAWGNRVIQLTDSTAPGGFLGIEDGSIIAGDFIPLIHGKGVGTGNPSRIGLHLLGEPGEDGSDDAAVNIQGRLNGVALINAPILTILNYSTELMRIAASGNVGIGTTNPGAELHIFNTENSSTKIVIDTPGISDEQSSDILLITKGNGYELIGTGIPNTKGWGIIARGDSNYWYETRNDILFSYWNGTSWNEVVHLDHIGRVGIGTSSPQGTLDVNGTIYQRGNQLHADYVFEPNYSLESIEEHSKYMWENKHLKAIPKAKVDKDGQEIIEVGAHRKGIVEELEKAHIYIEQLHKQNKALETLVSELSTRIEALERNN